MLWAGSPFQGSSLYQVHCFRELRHHRALYWSESGVTSWQILWWTKVTFSVPKRADLRWNRQFEDLEELVCLQDELLDSASLWDSCCYKFLKFCASKFILTASKITFNDFTCRLVKPGGILIYSTCSIDHEENENRVTAFVQRHPVRVHIKIIHRSFTKDTNSIFNWSRQYVCPYNLGSCW